MTLDPFDLSVLGVRSIRLYRAVCDAEYEQWRVSREFEIGPNSVEGKWFALNRAHAVAWGRWFASISCQPHDKIIAVKVPEDLYERFQPKLSMLDGIGPATFAPIELLRGRVFDEVQE